MAAEVIMHRYGKNYVTVTLCCCWLLLDWAADTTDTGS